VPSGLDPQLERHGVARLGEIELGQRLRAVGFETAKGVGQLQAQSLVQLGGNLLVNLSSVGRR